MEKEQEETSSEVAATKDFEIPDEDDDLREIIQIDEILGSSSSGQVKMLDFERQMFLDCVYNDGLVICGK